jgi:excisionase family DNA binding protein
LGNVKELAFEAKMVYTVNEVSKILGVNKNCVYNLINAGIIKTMKLGRQKITFNSLTEFLNKYDGYDLTDLTNIKCIHEYRQCTS